MRPGGMRVDGDAVLADLAREALGPGVDRRLGAEGAVDALGLRLAGDVDDAAPLALDHLIEQRVRELALAREVERHRLVPLLLGGVDLEGTAAAGVVDEDVDGAEAVERRLGDARRCALLHEVLDDQHRLGAAGGDDLAGQLLQQIGAPGDDGEPRALARQRQGDAAADADAGAGHQRGLAFEIEVHSPLLPCALRPAVRPADRWI